jgi:predicted nucleic acid-binding protein
MRDGSTRGQTLRHPSKWQWLIEVKPLFLQSELVDIEVPAAVLIGPTARHADIVSELLTQIGTGGNLVNDAHLAALAIEHRGGIVSYDSDFGRFDGVRWDTPEALLD